MVDFFLRLLGLLFTTFPTKVRGWALLILGVGVGVLFVLHGYPKITYLQEWAE